MMQLQSEIYRYHILVAKHKRFLVDGMPSWAWDLKGGEGGLSLVQKYHVILEWCGTHRKNTLNMRLICIVHYLSLAGQSIVDANLDKLPWWTSKLLSDNGQINRTLNRSFAMQESSSWIMEGDICNDSRMEKRAISYKDWKLCIKKSCDNVTLYIAMLLNLVTGRTSAGFAGRIIHWPKLASIRHGVIMN